jgi:hypothetical protein
MITFVEKIHVPISFVIERAVDSYRTYCRYHGCGEEMFTLL